MIRLILENIFLYLRVIKFKLLSKSSIITGKPRIIQPALFSGKGKILFRSGVVLGTLESPYLHSGYCYLNARNKSSVISFGEGVWTNNNLVIISNGSEIILGDNVIIGTNVEIYDSDFHYINPLQRKVKHLDSLPVTIDNNVWIGSNVKILKGVTIGKNSIIANGAIVSGNIPQNVIAGGIPAKPFKNVL
jgi:maltose O-acetyltransferase